MASNNSDSVDLKDALWSGSLTFQQAVSTSAASLDGEAFVTSSSYSACFEHQSYQASFSFLHPKLVSSSFGAQMVKSLPVTKVPYYDYIILEQNFY
jgi:hypothetical protein